MTLRSLSRSTETFGIALKVGSRSPNETGRIGARGAPKALIDRILTRCALGKQRAGRIALASGARRHSSIVIIISSKRGSVTTRPLGTGSCWFARSSVTSKTRSSGICSRVSSSTADVTLVTCVSRVNLVSRGSRHGPGDKVAPRMVNELTLKRDAPTKLGGNQSRLIPILDA